MRATYVLLVVLLAAACGGDGGLSRSAVTTVPPGSATGSAFSGAYTFEIRVTDCAGQCFVSGYSLCDIGDETLGSATVTQTDGRLVIDASDDFIVRRFEGGVDADGGFEVGGLATQLGGAVEVTSLAQGQIGSDGSIAGVVRTRGRGSVEGDGFSCTATYDLTGGAT